MSYALLRFRLYVWGVYHGYEVSIRLTAFPLLNPPLLPTTNYWVVRNEATEGSSQFLEDSAPALAWYVELGAPDWLAVVPDSCLSIASYTPSSFHCFSVRRKPPLPLGGRLVGGLVETVASRGAIAKLMVDGLLVNANGMLADC
jgi:hypothetical protein